MREAHLRDGAAVVEFLAWLDRTLQTRAVNEIEIDQVLTSFRAKKPKYLDLRLSCIYSCHAICRSFVLGFLII